MKRLRKEMLMKRRVNLSLNVICLKLFVRRQEHFQLVSIYLFLYYAAAMRSSFDNLSALPRINEL